MVWLEVLEMIKNGNFMKKLSKSKRKIYEQIVEQRVNEAFEKLWRVHTDWYYSKMLNGNRLDYWPSKNKYRYKGKTEIGDVFEFIKRNANPIGIAKNINE